MDVNMWKLSFLKEAKKLDKCNMSKIEMVVSIHI